MKGSAVNLQHYARTWKEALCLEFLVMTVTMYILKYESSKLRGFLL